MYRIRPVVGQLWTPLTGIGPLLVTRIWPLNCSIAMSIPIGRHNIFADVSISVVNIHSTYCIHISIMLWWLQKEIVTFHKLARYHYQVNTSVFTVLVSPYEPYLTSLPWTSPKLLAHTSALPPITDLGYIQTRMGQKVGVFIKENSVFLPGREIQKRKRQIIMAHYTLLCSVMRDKMRVGRRGQIIMAEKSGIFAAWLGTMVRK